MKKNSIIKITVCFSYRHLTSFDPRPRDPWLLHQGTNQPPPTRGPQHPPHLWPRTFGTLNWLELHSMLTWKGCFPVQHGPVTFWWFLGGGSLTKKCRQVSLGAKSLTEMTHWWHSKRLGVKEACDIFVEEVNKKPLEIWHFLTSDFRKSCPVPPIWETWACERVMEAKAMGFFWGSRSYSTWTSTRSCTDRTGVYLKLVVTCKFIMYQKNVNRRPIACRQAQICFWMIQLTITSFCCVAVCSFAISPNCFSQICRKSLAKFRHQKKLQAHKLNKTAFWLEQHGQENVLPPAHEIFTWIKKNLDA